MKYFLDTEYLQDYKFPDIIKTTLISVLKDKDEYEGRIICPKNNSVDLTKSGIINKNIEAFTKEVLEWIFDSSVIEELFFLKIYRKEKSTKRNIFEHVDDTCCWFLDLNKNEFNQFCENLEKNGMPVDLFYYEKDLVKLKEGFRGMMGFEKTYTPRQFKKYYLNDKRKSK